MKAYEYTLLYNDGGYAVVYNTSHFSKHNSDYIMLEGNVLDYYTFDGTSWDLNPNSIWVLSDAPSRCLNLNDDIDIATLKELINQEEDLIITRTPDEYEYINVDAHNDIWMWVKKNITKYHLII